MSNRTYSNAEDFCHDYGEDFLNTRLNFVSIDKGTMFYTGEYLGQGISCSVSEAFITDYHYSANDTIRNLVEGCYVTLMVNSEAVLVIS